MVPDTTRAFRDCLVLLLIAIVAGCGDGGSTNDSKTIVLRIGAGHSPSVAYAAVMKNYFQPELQRRVAEQTDFEIKFIEGYSGSIVKVNETLEGVQAGIIDIGGFCFCFEPSNLPLHAFQVMLPFGPSSPARSLAVAKAVYEQEPFLPGVFEDRFKQKLISLIATESYSLGTTFPWRTTDDLRGRKLAGAGLNLKWLEYVGATPVQSNLTEAYTSLVTHVYDGWIMFPDAWVKLKLYEPGQFFTETRFGSITWNGMTMSLRAWDRLPPEVQSIVAEVGADLETHSAVVAAESYDHHLARLRELGTDVREIDADVRKEWAQSLADWPRERAAELDKQGIPATRVLSLALAAAEREGYVWPVRYELD